MAAKFNFSRSPLRLLTYVIVVAFVAFGYWYRDRGSSARGRTLDLSTLSVNLDESFEILNGCRIVSNSGNDGDSFRVRHMGEEYTFRLYFVDCPETSDRYPDRLDYQAKYFGGLSPSQTVAVGKAASDFTSDLLSSRPWAILTRWEKVMQSNRFHAFILVEGESGSTEYLSEILVRNGLARIYTIGAPLPDGTTRQAFESRLKSLESEAKAAKVGAWRH